MGYTLGQYVKFENIDNDKFIENTLNGIVQRKESKRDLGGMVFYNECITLANNEKFSNEQNYYFHCKIKRMTEFPLQFNIKLISYNDNPSDSDYKEQFIKTIIIGSGQETWNTSDTKIPTLEDMWVDFEFIFTPLIDKEFDTILFELQRIVQDYREMIRYPKIIYEELGTINNVLNSSLQNNPPQVKKLIRIGVQSHPGLMMCINGEEIRICKSGIYELKNGVIKVSFFSAVSAAITTQNTKDIMTSIDDQVNVAMKLPTYKEKEDAMSAITSVCCFNETKTHQIDSFILDYLYDDEDK